MIYTILTGTKYLLKTSGHLTLTLSQRHLERLLAEYVAYYNNVRTHQALGGETPVESPRPPLTLVKDTRLKARPILGGLYHDYEKAA